MLPLIWESTLSTGPGSPAGDRLGKLRASASPKINRLGEIPKAFIPAFSPHAYNSPSRIGYTGRRSGEAGPALVAEGRRKPSSSGSAENGLPPATRGEVKAHGPSLRLLMPERARRACLCGTHGGPKDGFAGLFEVRPTSSSDLIRGSPRIRKIRRRPTVTLAGGPRVKPEDPDGCCGSTNTIRKGRCRGTGVADKNRRTGALRGVT